MANTPKYTFQTPSPYNAAISGGITAMGGILAEKSSWEKSSDQLNSFANVLRQEGLVGDALIYEQMALTQPDYVSAALTGKPTQRSLTQPFDHALKILSDEATRKNRLAEANIRGGEMSDYRQDMARRDDASDERALYKAEIDDLRTRSFKIDDLIDKAKDAGKPERVRSLKAEKVQIEGRIQELEGSIRNTLQEQKKLSKQIGSGGGGTNVGTEGAIQTPSGGEAPLPTKDPAGSYQGSPLLEFGPTDLEQAKKTTIGEPPPGAVATPATIPPFDWRDQVSKAAGWNPRSSQPTVAPLPSPSVAASQASATPAITLPEIPPFRASRSMGLPGAPQQQRFDSTEQISQAAEAGLRTVNGAAATPPASAVPTPAIPPTADVTVREPVPPRDPYKETPYPARVGGLLDASSFDRTNTKGLLNLNPLNPEPEVRRALPVEEEAPMETPEEAYAKEQVTKGPAPASAPAPATEEDPDVLEAQEKFNNQRDILIEGFEGVGLDMDGKSLAERLTEKAKDIDDLKVIERRLRGYRDNYGEYTDSQSAVDAGEKARKGMPQGEYFVTSVKRNPRSGGFTWYMVKKGSITLGNDGKWHGEDGTIWYPDPKTKFMVKVPPDGKPLYETKAGTNDGVTQSEWESDMEKLKKSKIFPSPDLENATPKQQLNNLTPGGATNVSPTPAPGTPASKGSLLIEDPEIRRILTPNPK